MWRGGVGAAYLLPALSLAGASLGAERKDLAPRSDSCILWSSNRQRK